MDDERYFQILELMQSVNETVGHLVIGDDQRTIEQRLDAAMEYKASGDRDLAWETISALSKDMQTVQETWPKQ